MADIILLPGKEKRVYSGHPWVFRSDIARTKGDPQPGDTVRVTSSAGRFLCMAVYNPRSQIALRVLSRRDERWTGRSSGNGCEGRWRIGGSSPICGPAG